MLWRHSNLVIVHLRTHPEYLANKEHVKSLFDRQNRVFNDLEEIKPLIKAEREQWERRAEAKADGKVEARGFGIRPPPKELDFRQNQDLAVELALKRPRGSVDAYGGLGDWMDTVSGEYVSAPAKEIDSKRPRDAQRLLPAEPPPSKNKYNQADNEDLERSMRVARRLLEERYKTDVELRPRPNTMTRPSGARYKYPTIYRPQEFESRPERFSPDPRPEIPIKAPSLPPMRPPKPQQPFKEPVAGPEDPPKPQRPFKEPVAGPERPPKETEQRVHFRPVAYLENGVPLRPMILPSDFRDVFLEQAAPHTRRRLEMCGMICGQVHNDVLLATQLVIPEQTSTADTCTTTNEISISEHCIAHEVITMGWIHTHPTQTCFMSSVDVHTHAGHQGMLDESIAIVCAPSYSPS